MAQYTSSWTNSPTHQTSSPSHPLVHGTPRPDVLQTPIGRDDARRDDAAVTLSWPEKSWSQNTDWPSATEGASYVDSHGEHFVQTPYPGGLGDSPSQHGDGEYTSLSPQQESVYYQPPPPSYDYHPRGPLRSSSYHVPRYHPDQMNPFTPTLRSYPSLPNIRYTDDAAEKETPFLRRICFNCRMTEPPSWRRCTLNPGKIVCNKCGIYARTHGRTRPPHFDQMRPGRKSAKSKGEYSSKDQKIGATIEPFRIEKWDMKEGMKGERSIKSRI